MGGVLNIGMIRIRDWYNRRVLAWCPLVVGFGLYRCYRINTSDWMVLGKEMVIRVFL